MVRVRHAASLLVIPLLPIFLIPMVAQVHAQAPSAGTPFPAVRCTVEPRTVDELSRPVSQASPAPFTYMGELPSGEPADAATIDAVTSTVRERIECRKTGDWLRWLALTTDDYIRRTTSPDAGTPPPVPPTSEPQESLQDLRLLSIQEVTLLDDGRVSAVVTVGGTQAVEDEHPAPGRTYLMFFRNVDGRWLLDEEYTQVVIEKGPMFVADLLTTPSEAPATPPA